ncbi:hypothetical protein H7E67_13200 [Clostridium gasigenes]|uniref:hypothetical protein n=1 Tax=Clostridium gasigenes TaxID=94869 RepID=UPI00162A6774|nr:hypothetical protein [Clostridium gasigenes]MBB6624392.1 hypothetical protein [Clostridium gasigenes]MBU3088713.1 hypothetical protein [Clostridium gasigenes]
MYIGASKKLVDYNRINYYFDYEKTTDVEEINLGMGTVNKRVRFKRLTLFQFK